MEIVIKVIGSLCILISCTLLGFFTAEKRLKRIKQLREIQGLLSVLENEISYMNSVLTDALIRAGDKIDSKTSNLFKDTAHYILKEKCLVDEAINKSIQKNRGGLELKENEYEIIRKFGCMLGKSDKTRQAANILNTLECLKLEEKKVYEEYMLNRKLYKNLGFYGGLTLIILLL